MTRRELVDTLATLRARGLITIDKDGDDLRVRPTAAGTSAKADHDAALRRLRGEREPVEPDARD